MTPSLDDLTQLVAQYKGLLTAVLSILAPTGIWKWWVVYRDRVRVKVRQLGTAGPDIRFIGFNAENVSDKLTSMEPVFTLVGYTPKREQQIYRFTFETKERQLLPHKEAGFVAAHGAQNINVLFLWYMTLKIPLTKGKAIRLRYRNADFVEVGVFPFYAGLIVFRVFGWVPNPAPPSKNAALAIIAEYQAQETLIAGMPEHPALAEHRHKVAVVQCKLVNQSKMKKAQVTDVKAYQRNGDELPITWSDGIDDLGNPDHCGNLILVESEAMLYLRHNWGQSINYARIVIEHNMPSSPAVATLDDWHAVGVDALKGA